MVELMTPRNNMFYQQIHQNDFSSNEITVHDMKEAPKTAAIGASENSRYRQRRAIETIDNN